MNPLGNGQKDLAGPIRKIPVSELRPGMRVVNTGLSWIDHPYLYSQEGQIGSDEDIQSIRDQGYLELFIAEGPGAGGGQALPGAAATLEQILATRDFTPLTPQRRPATPEEYEGAQVFYSQSLSFAREFIKDVSQGKPVDYEASTPLVENIIDSVSRNPDTLVSLTKLRCFDEYTFTHCINVAVLAVIFGKFLGLGRSALHVMGMAGLFHDIGKALIPADILNKPGRLTDLEFRMIQNHPDLGATHLAQQPGVPPVVISGVKEHHEKFNGTGYPRGLNGMTVSLAGAVIGVVDVYDALTSKRTYKNAITPNNAMRIMFGMRGADFPAEMVEAFIKCLGIYPVGTLVRLGNGQVAVVVASNTASPLYPTVKIILTKDLNPLKHLTADLTSAQARAMGDAWSITAILDCYDLGVDPMDYLM